MTPDLKAYLTKTHPETGLEYVDDELYTQLTNMGTTYYTHWMATAQLIDQHRHLFSLEELEMFWRQLEGYRGPDKPRRLRFLGRWPHPEKGSLLNMKNYLQFLIHQRKSKAPLNLYGTSD